jgi:hypothetical protein
MRTQDYHFDLLQKSSGLPTEPWIRDVYVADVFFGSSMPKDVRYFGRTLDLKGVSEACHFRPATACGSDPGPARAGSSAIAGAVTVRVRECRVRARPGFQKNIQTVNNHHDPSCQTQRH